MAYIAVNSTGDFVKLQVIPVGAFANATTAFAETANVMTIPALQDITVNAAPGTFRWKQLDTASELVVTTPSTNSLTCTVVLDPTTFFTGHGSTAGIFGLTSNKTELYFKMFWQGETSGDKFITGRGYITSLAPTVNPDAPVWTSPITIEVTGDYSQGTVAP